MKPVTSIRPYHLNVPLRFEERNRLDLEAEAQGISRAEVLRRACPAIFKETGVRAGRATGVSPWKLNQSEQ